MGKSFPMKRRTATKVYLYRMPYKHFYMLKDSTSAQNPFLQHRRTMRNFLSLSLLSLLGAAVDSFQTVVLSKSPPKSALQAYTQEGNDQQQAAHPDRRAFVSSGILAAASTLLVTSQPDLALAAAEGVDYKAIAKDIMDLVEKNPDWGPTFVRLAWHSSGTYDKETKTGGSGAGTIRFKEELAHGGNAGLSETAVKWLEPIHAKYDKDGLSYADLYTLAGVASIKALGGPTIEWSSGRIDQLEDFVTPDGRLPAADSGPPLADKSDADHLRKIFGRMGFNDQEIVILSGAHALGRCHTTASGYDGPWTPTPTTFNNAYYTLLSSLNWIPKDWSGPPQYVDAPTGKLMMLPTDLVLLDDKSFLKWVKVYAKDGQKFDKDFAKTFQKLEELGTSGLIPTEWA